MKTAALFQFFRTGNRQARDYCSLKCRNVYPYDTFFDDVYPLDAPDDLPAGSCTSTEYKNWRGRPIAAQSSFKR